MGIWGSALAGSLDNESLATRDAAANRITAEMIPIARANSLIFMRVLAVNGRLLSDMMTDAAYRAMLASEDCLSVAD